MTKSTSFIRIKFNILSLFFFIFSTFFFINTGIINAQEFAALGSGVDGSVRAVTVYNGDLIAAGTFNIAGVLVANGIAKWDGNNWSPLAQGMNGPVYAVTVYNGDLYAGGSFTMAGGVPANRIARWNGTSWVPLGSGVNSTVYCLEVFTNALILGGSFTTAGGLSVNRIVRWNGNWEVIGAGPNATVYAMTLFNNQLYVGGMFTTIGGVTVNRITRWDGTNWFTLGNGIDNGFVYSLYEYDSAVVVGGSFSSASGVTANNIASWNGSSWSSFSTGMGGGSVRSLTVYLDELFAGGLFTTAGGVSVDRIAKWNGSIWSTLGGTNGPVLALGIFDATLITGGDFTNAGGVNASRIAKWGSIPVAPVLVSPPNVSTQITLTPTLDWNGVSNAFDYGVQVSVEPNFSSTVIDVNELTSTEYQVPNGILNLNTVYFWRTTARNGMGTSPYSSIWYFTTTSTYVYLTSSQVPTEFKLYANYPNPFNPSTKIKFDLPTNGIVKVSIFDILGREIENLLNQVLVPGTYETEWNASGFTSGVYFFRMEVEDLQQHFKNFLDTKKMLLVK